jgi:hypothetical protein
MLSTSSVTGKFFVSKADCISVENSLRSTLNFTLIEAKPAIAFCVRFLFGQSPLLGFYQKQKIINK